VLVAREGLLAGRRGVVLGLSTENSLACHVIDGLVAEGAAVAATYRPSRVTSAPGLAEKHGCVHSVALDANDDDSIARAFSAIGDRWGRLDFLVHSIMHVDTAILDRPLTAIGRDEFRAVVDIGAYSLIAACRHALPLLRRGTSPRIVTITSECGRRITPRYHAAGIAKAALESAMRFLAGELGRDGILVNAVSPGLIETDGALRTIGINAAAAARNTQARRAATHRAVQPDDVAGCVAWLASPLARNLTAEIIVVDGGFAKSYA
jgi:enoyl-[acyl-carrier protein] reductase I